MATAAAALRQAVAVTLSRRFNLPLPLALSALRTAPPPRTVALSPHYIFRLPTATAENASPATTTLSPCDTSSDIDNMTNLPDIPLDIAEQGKGGVLRVRVESAVWAESALSAIVTQPPSALGSTSPPTSTPTSTPTGSSSSMHSSTDPSTNSSTSTTSSTSPSPTSALTSTTSLSSTSTSTSPPLAPLTQLSYAPLLHLYGQGGFPAGARVVVEHCSPNMAKPFHAGHLRSTVLGGVLARMCAALGADVTRLSYLGDTGRPVGLVLDGFARFGDRDALARDPLRHLYDVYVAATRAALGNNDDGSSNDDIDSTSTSTSTNTASGKTQHPSSSHIPQNTAAGGSAHSTHRNRLSNGKADRDGVGAETASSFAAIEAPAVTSAHGNASGANAALQSARRIARLLEGGLSETAGASGNHAKDDATHGHGDVSNSYDNATRGTDHVTVDTSGSDTDTDDNSTPGNGEWRTQWAHFRRLSLAQCVRVAARLGVAFDRHDAESCYTSTATLADTLAALTAAGRSPRCERNGALVADFADARLPTAVLVKADGGTTYLSRDYAAACDREKRDNPDLMFYVVGTPQALHFQQLFHLLRKTGHAALAEGCRHVNFGSVLNMSTRHGTAVFLDDILNEAKDRMLANMKGSPNKIAEIDNIDAVAEQLAVSAVVIQDLRQRRVRDYPFDWTRMLQTEGDTGVFLQYTHARLTSLEDRFRAEIGLHTDESLPDPDYALLAEPEAERVCHVLGLFDDTLAQATREAEPALLVQYLLHLARAANAAHARLRVLGQPTPMAATRMRLFSGVRHTLARGLGLLGLTPLRRM